MVFAIIVFVFSCTRQNAEQQFKDQRFLNEDAIFIGMVNETYDYLKLLSFDVRASYLNRDDVSRSLFKLQYKNLSFDAQMKEIDGIFKASVSGRLKSHIVATQKSLHELTSIYGKIDAATMNREVEKVLARAPRCSWRYYLCAAAATAAAILCHAACESTALATTAGLGIYACVMACGTLQAYAISECQRTHCD